jgi:hypothetical protein
MPLEHTHTLLEPTSKSLQCKIILKILLKIKLMEWNGKTMHLRAKMNLENEAIKSE